MGGTGKWLEDGWRKRFGEFLLAVFQLWSLTQVLSACFHDYRSCESSPSPRWALTAFQEHISSHWLFRTRDNISPLLLIFACSSSPAGFLHAAQNFVSCPSWTLLHLNHLIWVHFLLGPWLLMKTILILTSRNYRMATTYCTLC